MVSCAQAGGDVRFRFQLEGEVNALRIPAAQPFAGFADGLWQHTCFEAFVSTAAGSAYREFNFSPSGEWAAYAFTNYRQRDTSWQPAATPSIHVRRNDEIFELEATIPASLLAIPSGAPTMLHIGLSAVIETNGGTLSYWALAHAGERPDFHLHTAFRLLLAPHTDLP